MTNTKYALGAKPSRYDPRDYRYAHLAPNHVLAPENIPSKHYPEKLVPIRDQGDYGMCVAFACCTIKEFEELAEREVDTFETPVPSGGYSQAWIYGNRKPGQYEGEGMEPRDALANLISDGVPEHNLIPLDVGDYPTCKSVVQQYYTNLLDKARPQRLKTYAAVNWKNPSEVKSALCHTGPCLVSIAVYNTFFLYGMGVHFNGDFDTIEPVVNDDPQKEGLQGYHAIAAIGYNEKGIICQNSWGDSWGYKGYFLIPWGASYVQEFWALTDWSPTPVVTLDLSPHGNPSMVKILAVGSNVIRVDGADITLDAAPLLVEFPGGITRTVVPIRGVAEALKREVEWDQLTQTVLIF